MESKEERLELDGEEHIPLHLILCIVISMMAGALLSTVVSTFRLVRTVGVRYSLTSRTRRAKIRNPLRSVTRERRRCSEKQKWEGMNT